jgi:glycosyltransferase involved in cell wall biosynthesis
MLWQRLQEEPGLEVSTFTYRQALTGRYDVFHAHWPEVLVSGHSSLKKLVRQALFLALLVRIRLRRTPIIQTVHNLRLPTGISRRERWLLLLAQRLITLRIRLNETTELPAGSPSATILHGHYRDWFAAHAVPAPQPGRVTFFGLVRQYKGIDGLITAFRDTAGTMPGLSLRVAGQPSTEELAAALRAAADGDDRITLSFHFLSDAELVHEVGQAELVVLPYREMHNSGGALAALSLGRPVLVPDNENNRRLSDEVGPGWVFRYSGALTGRHITDALTALRAEPAGSAPDLTRRQWEHAATEHLAAYRAAVAHRGSRG